MNYGVTAEVMPPEGSSELNALQREGVAALLEHSLDRLQGAVGSDGVEIDLLDYWVGAHPEGALVLLVVDAPAIEVAEEATEPMVSELLDQTELLAEWRITKCEVGLNELLAKRGLAAAEGHEAPPHDPTDRAAGHAAERARAEARRAQTTDPDEKMKGLILAAAGHLRAFDLDAFGFDPENPDGATSEELARLAAGALIFSTFPLIDYLFEDIEALASNRDTVADHDDLWVLGELPPQFATHYNELFARKFLIATSDLTGRLTQSEWDPPQMRRRGACASAPDRTGASDT